MKKIFTFLLVSSSLFSNQALIIDRYFSPYMGAYDLLFTHRALTNLADYAQIETYRDSTKHVWGRALEQLIVWAPLNLLGAVTQHEFFGHGYRGRELGYAPSKYKITPWVGSTSFDSIESMRIGEVQAINIAGIQAEAILARQAKMNWIQCGAIDGRLSTLYTQSQQIEESSGEPVSIKLSAL